MRYDARMTKSLGIVLVGILSCTVTLAAQVEQPAKKPVEKPVKVRTPVGDVQILESKEAKALVAEIKKSGVLKRARRSKKSARTPAAVDPAVAERLVLLQRAATVQHKTLVPLLHRVVLSDADVKLRVAAAHALSAQPMATARRAAFGLVDKRELMEKSAIAAPLIRLLSAADAPAKTWKSVRRRFLELDYDAKRALFAHIGQHKDWDALDLLLAHLDAPAPKDVHAADNPPVSYWKKRWDDWKEFKPDLMRALQQLLGKRFDDAKKARTWIEEQGGVPKLRRKKR